METFPLSLSIFKNIGGIPQSHEKPLKHALYNALALLLLFLCCAAAWALYIILQPFFKPLIWAVLVGSVLHPIKHSLARKYKQWFNNLEELNTPLIVGICVIPVNIVDDLSEFIGGKLKNNIKIIGVIIFSLTFSHILYYYTPDICTLIMWNIGLLIYNTITILIEYSTTKIIGLLLIGYISLTTLWWSPRLNNCFQYIGIIIWFLFSCYISNLSGSFQISVFFCIQLIFLLGFISEVLFVHTELQKTNQSVSIIKSTLWTLQNKPFENKIYENEEKIKKTEMENKSDNSLKKVKDPWKLELFEIRKTEEQNKKKLIDEDILETDRKDVECESGKLIEPSTQKMKKLQRSLSQPIPISQLNKMNKIYLSSLRPQLNPCFNEAQESFTSDIYLYFLLWACAAMLFWKNMTLLPLLPLPIIVYVLKHVGLYFGLWQFLNEYCIKILNLILKWCEERYDALVPIPARGLYRTLLKINEAVKQNIKNSIDTVSSVIVILGLIIFVTCASVFFAIQIYAEAIKLVQTTGNVINNTVVHNPELRQLLPPSLEETLDSVLDNAYIYGREGISKVIRSMVHDADSGKTAKLERQVLELWDRIYQAWMSSENTTGPVVTSDAVQISWEAFMTDIKKSSEMFNIKGLTEFIKQNIGTFMSVLESVWSILKGNLSILLGSFSALVSILLGGGTAVLNFILNMIVFLTTLFYLLSSSGDVYKPLDIIINFSPNNSRLNRFGEALAGAINSVFKVSLKMALFYGMWTWFIHNLFNVKIVYLPSALATILGAVPFLGTYWACIPAVLDLWLAQSCGFKATILAIFQFLPTMVVDTAIYTEIKGGHPYLTGLAIAGGIFCLGFEGAIIGPLLLCGLYVVADLSSSLFKETPTEEIDPLQKQISRFNANNY